MKVQISGRAATDIESVMRWFASQYATEAGRQWSRGLFAKFTELESNPSRHPLVEEAAAVPRTIRELHYGHRPNVYRIIFEVRGNAVRILRIWHSARDALSVDDL